MSLTISVNRSNEEEVQLVNGSAETHNLSGPQSLQTPPGYDLQRGDLDIKPKHCPTCMQTIPGPDYPEPDDPGPDETTANDRPKQSHQEQEDEDQLQLDHWISQLSASRPAEFLCDKPRLGTLPSQSSLLEFTIEPHLHESLHQFCQQHKLTELAVLSAAFRVTHYRLTGAIDALLGIATDHPGREGSALGIGFMGDLQCIQISIEDESFEEVVHQVQQAVSPSKTSQKLPFRKILAKIEPDEALSGRPLLPVLFVLHSAEQEQFTFSGDKTSSMASPITSMFDIEFHLFQKARNLRGSILFCTEMYHPETIRGVASVFQRVIECVIDQPTIPVTALPLLTDDDYSVLDTMGLIQIDQTSYPRESSVIDAFRQQVAAHPSKTAVKDSVTELTYAQLDALSDTVTLWLASRAFATEAIIGVLADRTCETIVVFLGILKANLAYLPFDVRSPVSRVEAILSSIPGPRLVLVGNGIQPPVIQLRDVEFVPFKQLSTDPVQNNLGVRDTIPRPVPSATSLAYVMFTSGSTGAPKGVMVEHRGIVRLVKESNIVHQLPSTITMAHLSNTAFDASIWEIYAALLNGGTLICIDTATVLDYEALSNVFAYEKIQTAFLTTALFKQYTHDCPSIFSQLGMLCVGGERFDLQDLAAAQEVMTGRFIHVYGPTENTTFSTMYPVLQQAYPNGLPIGHTISNSGACIMDPQQRLVPLGVIGELVVTGDGLSRGYTDPNLNPNRFISVEINGKQVRAYRTGDLVRHRPIDGQLEYFGRLDGQVKIRGNRVELGEIEHIMRSHGPVRDAAAVLQHDGRLEPQLVAFATIQLDGKLNEQTNDDDKEKKHVHVWRKLYDEGIYSSIHTMPLEKVGRDFTGWTSMYNGREIDTDEMNEWLDDTIETILNGGRSGHVLEIGTGSGMILFNLDNGLESYVGLDPSEAAVDLVTKRFTSNPTLVDKVHLYKATATDIPHLDTPIAPNLVVLNSVVQYFPSQEYLFKVIQDVLLLQGPKTIFFGDIRSQALYREFRVARALRIFDGNIAKEEMRSQTEDEESELLVDPGFFTSLRNRLPDLVEHVEILPKKMRATNELSCYRYAAVVYAKGQTQQQQIHHIDEKEWVDFRECGLERESLLQLLQRSSSSSTVAVSNIPYSKSIVERFLVDSLEQKTTGTTDEADWMSAIRKEAKSCYSLSPIDLMELSEQSGYRVEISWARQYSQRGGLDAIFHRYEPVNGRSRTMFRFPVDHQGRELHSLSSQPLRLQVKQDVQKQLHEKLKSQLPSYMIPKEIKVLDQMPINPNGKVDRRALAQMVHRRTAAPELIRQPTTEAGRQMQKIWAEGLKLDISTFGLDDSFFDLGGNSLAAMRIVGAARKVGLELTVQDIFRHKNLGNLVSQHVLSSRQTTTELKLVELIDSNTKKALLEKIDSLHLGVRSTSIAEIFPITSIQNEFFYRPTAWREYYDYYYMDLDNDHLDLACFKKNCALTLERYPILRTCFLQIMGQYWQVVLHQLDSPLHIEDVHEDLDQFFRTLVLNDLRELSENQPPTAIMLFRHSVQGTRLAVRMQHAQNDAISIPIIFKSLVNGFELRPPSSDAPSFFHYMSYIYQRRSMAISYWKNLLRGSSVTEIKPKLRPQSCLEDPMPKPLDAHTQVDLPELPDKSIMISTLVHTAWAVLLARLTGEYDVVYWHNVAGRNSAIQGVEDIVGPCMSTVPARVGFSSFQTPLQLLQSIQQQLMATGEADSLGKDIIELCTDWPSGIFDSVMQHQSFGETPTLECFGAERQIRFFENPYLLEPYPWMASYSQDGRLHISLFATTSIITMEKAKCITKDICKIVGELANSLHSPLRAWMDDIQLSV